MKTFKLFVMAVLMVGAAACTDFEEPITPADETPTTRAVVDPAALRASAAVANPNNPYAVSNLNKAMIQYSKLYGVQPKPIYASHEYVRFQAKDSLDYYILEDSLNLELFDYPLDRILSASEMDFYSNDVENGGKWLYTAVPKYFRYPTEITRQVLQDVYLQGDGTIVSPVAASADEEIAVDGEENDENSMASNVMNEDLYEQILRISMQNAGIEFVDGPSSTGGKTWEPSAMILYKDDLTGETLPLTYVKVRVNTMMNVGTGYTDNNGRVVITKGSGGRFRNSVNYEARFVTREWKILSNSSGFAKISGDKGSKSPWACIVEPRHVEVSAYAAVHRAMYHMFFKQNEITKPIHNVGRMRVAVFWDKDNGAEEGYYYCWQDWWGMNAIKLYGKNKTYIPRHRIIRNTLHELGHASHRHAAGIIDYDNTDRRTKESYANAAAYYLMSKIYPHNSSTEYMTNYHDNYTGIGEALINHGFSIKQIESAVKQSRTWGQFQNSIKSFHIIPDWLTDFLFDHPHNVWDYNVLTEAVFFADSSDIAYVNIPKRIRLTQMLFGVARAQVLSWTAVPSRMKVSNIIGYNADLTFLEAGNYTVSANVRLDNGVEFSSTKSVTVKTRPSITGSKSVRIGEAAQYALDDNTYFKNWEIKYKKDGEWIDGRDRVIPIGSATNFTTQPILNIVFKGYGDYQISATIDYNVAQDKTTYNVSVPTERIITDPNDAIPGLFPVASWQHKTDKNIIQRIYDSPRVVVPLTYTRWTTDNDFYTFNMLPQSSHPYYSLMQPVYRYPFEGNEAYDVNTGYFSGNRFFPYPSTEKVFYVLREQVPGSVPLYCMEMNAVDYNGNTLSKCRILSNYIPNTGNIFENGNYNYKKVRLIGYVFPKK